MSDVPSQCPTCSTAIPPGASQCPGCRRVFGEANRCPHCHAIAPVRASRGGYVCVACNKPRSRDDGTVVQGGGGAIEPTDARAAAGQSAGFALRAFGIVSIVGGALAGVATLALVGISLPTVLVAGVVGAAGVGVGALSLRAGARAQETAEARWRADAEQAIYRLAAERGGSVTATDVATALKTDTATADALLTELVADGSRVQVDVSGDGVVLYRFLEVLAAQGPRVRVADSDLEARFDALEEQIAAEEGGAEGERER